MEVPVEVLLRVTCRWWDRLFVTMEFQVDFPSCGHIECLLSKLLQELTTADPSEEWAIRYRRDYHRSLRVGDAVVIGETAWAVEPSGWARVALQADEVVNDGLGRMRSRQHWAHQWHGDWRACMAADVADSGEPLERPRSLSRHLVGVVID
jgi:hypothetical protein